MWIPSFFLIMYEDRYTAALQFGLPYPLNLPTPTNGLPDSVRDVFMSDMGNKLRSHQERHRALNRQRYNVLDRGFDVSFSRFANEERYEQIRRELHARPDPHRAAFRPTIASMPSLAGYEAGLEGVCELRVTSRCVPLDLLHSNVLQAPPVRHLFSSCSLVSLSHFLSRCLSLSLSLQSSSTSTSPTLLCALSPFTMYQQPISTSVRSRRAPQTLLRTSTFRGPSPASFVLSRRCAPRATAASTFPSSPPRPPSTESLST